MDDVGYTFFNLSKIPDRFEPGLQNYAGAIGAEAGVNYLRNIRREDIQQHEFELTEYITNEILNFPKINLLGPKDPKLRTSVINFYIEGMDSGELSIILDRTNNIMTRSGVHCSHAWYKKYKLPPTLRAPVYFYNTIDEAEFFVQTIKKIIKYF